MIIESKKILPPKKKTLTSLSNDEKNFYNDFQTHHYSYVQKTVDPFTWLAMQLLNKQKRQTPFKMRPTIFNKIKQEKMM